MKNGDMPATPVDRCNSDAIEAGIQVFSGMTKREMFCLHMGVAETGDAELDAIIHKGNCQKMAALVASGLISDPQVKTYEVAAMTIRVADSLLTELDKTGGKFVHL